MQSFAPADEALLFRPKSDCSKSFRARPQAAKNPRRTESTLRALSNENAADGRFDHSLPGPSASVPNKMARELAALKQPSPKS